MTKPPAPLLWKSRHGVYYLRLIVPKALRALDPSIHTEIRRSLKTRCHKEALKKVHLLWSTKFIIGENNCMSWGFSDINNATKQKTLSQKTRAIPLSSFTELEALHIKPAIQPQPLIELVGIESNKDIISLSPEKDDTKSKLPISELIRLYCEDHISAENWTTKTALENRAIYSLFIRIIGDLPCANLIREDFIRYRGILQKLPSNINKSPRFRERTIDEILKMQDVVPLAPCTINKYITRIQALFEWAADNTLILRNPAQRLKIKERGHQRDKREAFTTADLQSLLNGQVCPENRSELLYRYWIILLGMFTGARLEEICQLHTNDIQLIDNIWCISINDNDNKRLKNMASKRIIPIHSKLLELGFLSLVQKRRKYGDKRLFPNLKKARDGYHSAISKWFSGYKRKNLIASNKKSYHSFRHTVANALKQSGAPVDQAAAIIGHSTKQITYERYGKQYNPVVLKDVIEKINYDLDYSLIPRI